ncbi:MAG: single-stranded DNA-binding protein [Planctomycetota bacterium]|nr:single-stranded DNA-binding protein [Planctomycetota bacterium]
MANYNRVILMGNLTRDPEIRYTPSGTAVVTLGVAVNRRYRDPKTNEIREETTFVDVDVFGRQAEVASEYLAKGRPIFIEGRLRLDQWDDKQTGQKRSKLRVVCERYQFLGPRSGGAATGGGQTAGGAAGQPAAGKRPAGTAPEEDIPQEDLGIQDDSIPF